MKGKNYFLTILALIAFLSSCTTSGGYLESRYMDISKNVLPSVVEIISIGIDEDISNNNWQDFFQDQEDFQSDKMNTGVGSGVIIESDDNIYYILTNKHVVGNLEKVSVLLYNNEMISGDVIGSDDRFDIAVIKIKSETNFPVAKLYAGSNLKVGQFVAALGSPMSYVQSISMGIISNHGRFGGPKQNLSNYIQTDAAINHGNSGGPLVNMKGEVIGINTWISSPTSGNIGLGFAMPIENIYPSYRSIVDNGEVKIGWVGVSSYGIPDTEFYTDKNGAFINQIVVDSPAYRIGIKPGDIIIKVNNKDITSSAELFLNISLLQPEDSAKIFLDRLSNNLNFSLILGEAGDNVLETSKKVFPGFILAERDDKIVILQVLPKSIGLSSGFLKDDILLSINGKVVNKIEDFYKFLKKDNNILFISRDEKEVELKLYY